MIKRIVVAGIVLLASPAAALAQTAPTPNYVPVPAGNVWPGVCQAPPTTFGNVWYFDPVNGKSPSAWAALGLQMGTGASPHQGDQAHPWNNLNAVMYPLGVNYPTGYTSPLSKLGVYNYAVAAPSPNPLQPFPAGWTWGYTAWFGPNDGPIQSGDELLLAGGDYGAINWGYQTSIIPSNPNPGWLTIAPAPGAHPVIESLIVNQNNIHILPGIEISSHTNRNLVTIAANNAVIEGAKVDNDPTVQPTQPFLAANYGVGLQMSGTCVSFVNSHIFNVDTGAAINFVDHSKFEGNEIDHFGQDAIDHANENYVSISRNFIHDPINTIPGTHPDAIQGFVGIPAPGQSYVVNSYIWIVGNRIIRSLDQNLQFPQVGLQGISAFDAAWDHVTIANNVASIFACDGFTWASITNSYLGYNTIVSDIPSGEPCQPAISIGPYSHEAFAYPSHNDLVTGNLASGITNLMGPPNFPTADPTIVFTGNVTTSGVGGPAYYGGYLDQRPGGQGFYISAHPGQSFMYDGNLIVGAIVSTLLKSYSSTSSSGLLAPGYDFHLSPRSHYNFNVGLLATAPPTNIEGVARATTKPVVTTAVTPATPPPCTPPDKTVGNVETVVDCKTQVTVSVPATTTNRTTQVPPINTPVGAY